MKGAKLEKWLKDASDRERAVNEVTQERKLEARYDRRRRETTAKLKGRQR